MSDADYNVQLGRVLGALDQNQAMLTALRSELLREVGNVREDVKDLKEGLDRQGREFRGEHTKLDIRVTNLEMTLQRVRGGWTAVAVAASVAGFLGAGLVNLFNYWQQAQNATAALETRIENMDSAPAR